MISNFTMKAVFHSLFALVVLLVVSNGIYAQEKGEQPENNFNTLFGDNITYGGYGALSVGHSQISHYNAFTFGVQGAWVIAHSVAIGLAGRAFVTETTNDIAPFDEWATIGGGYGGLFIEPIFFGKQPIHFTTPVILGLGAVSYNGRTGFEDFYYDELNDWDEFFVFEPGLEIELNITRFFRLAAGVSYRFTSDVHLTTTYVDPLSSAWPVSEHTVLEDKDMNSLNFKLAFKFGKF